VPGSAALRLSAAEAAIAASATFGTRVGAGSEAEAKARIHFDQVSVPADELAAGVTLEQRRPCCILALDRHGYIQIGEGAHILLGGTGGVIALFTDAPKFAHDHKASYLDCIDWVSQVIDEVADVAGQNTNWPFNSIELWLDPWRPAIGDRQADDFWLMGYLLSDHINAGA
jgi:hypothetical protein